MGFSVVFMPSGNCSYVLPFGKSKVPSLNCSYAFYLKLASGYFQVLTCISSFQVYEKISAKNSMSNQRSENFKSKFLSQKANLIFFEAFLPKGLILLLIFPVLVIVLLQCLTSSSFQSYRINIAKAL